MITFDGLSRQGTVFYTRQEKREMEGGGGVIIHRSTIGVAGSKAASECSSFSSFEFVGALLCVNSIYIDLLVIYRPPLNSISLLRGVFFTSGATSLLNYEDYNCW
jgi:hypothetical protein